jgi:hypothetical protein
MEGNEDVLGMPRRFGGTIAIMVPLPGGSLEHPIYQVVETYERAELEENPGGMATVMRLNLESDPGAIMVGVIEHKIILDKDWTRPR